MVDPNIDDDNPLLSGGVQLLQEGIIGRAFKFRDQRPFFFDGKSNDARRVDRLPLIHHKNIVEIEKIQRSDCLQLSDIRTSSSDVSCNKRSKVSLS
jgi:hypothetical protein